MTDLPARWAEKTLGELDAGNTVALDWVGPRLERRPIADLGAELGCVTQDLADALDRIDGLDAMLNCPNLRRPIEDWARALSMAAPIFRMAPLPRSRRVAMAPTCHAILNRVDVAALQFIAAYAKAHTDFLTQITQRA